MFGPDNDWPCPRVAPLANHRTHRKVSTWVIESPASSILLSASTVSPMSNVASRKCGESQSLSFRNSTSIQLT
jgi:hypothetical protein